MFKVKTVFCRRALYKI